MLWNKVKENRKAAIVIAEIIVLIVYSIYVFLNYSGTELVYRQEDMQIQRIDSNFTAGYYLDLSFEDAKAIVTPAFFLQKGVYNVSFRYRENGIVKAGFIYEHTRDGRELVDNEEFVLNPKCSEISYRITMKDNTGVRFKLRLTGDASGDDYIILDDFSIVQSKLSIVYRIFILFAVMMLVNGALIVYEKFLRGEDSRQKAIILALGITVFIAGFPFFEEKLSSGVDLTFHLQRIEGVYKGLLSGQFPVRIQPQWIDDHGYAVSVFYGDILLYFPALLRMIGFTLQDAFKIYMLVILTGTTFVSFFSFKKIFSDDIATLTGTILYVCSNEHIRSRYFSWALGSFSAMMFYPLILAGLYILFAGDIKDRQYKRTWLYLLIGFSGILQTHMISCLLVSLFTAILCIICIKRFFRKETLIEVGKAVGAWVLLNLWFLVPFLQYMTGDYGITATLATDEPIIDRYALLANFTDAGKTWKDIFSDNSGIGYAMILVLLCYVFSIPFLERSKNKIGKESLVCFGMVVMGIWFCTDYFPVIAVARFGIVQKFCLVIQNQDRIMYIVVILLACLGGFLITELKENRKAELYLAIAFCICAFYQDILYFQSMQLEETYLDQVDLISWPANHPYSYAIGNGEYLPVHVNLSDLSREVTYNSEMLQVDIIRSDYLCYELQINNLSDTEQQMIFPLLFYDGYQCRNVKTGEQLQICAGDNGMVSVVIPANYDGLLKLDFAGFWYWRLAEIISLLAMMFIIWIIYHYRNCGALKSVDLEKLEKMSKKKH